MIYAGLMDLVTLKIRNTLVVGIGLAWLVLAPLAGFSWNELGASAGVGGAVLVDHLHILRARLDRRRRRQARRGDGALVPAARGAALSSPMRRVLGGILTLVILQLRDRR